MRRVGHYALVLLTCVLILVALTGPLVAFFLVSCASARSCRIGLALLDVGATCAEGTGERSDQLLHGEECTVVCRAGRVSSQSKLVCDDGEASGSAELQCAPAPTPPPEALAVGALVEDAVTDGEDRTACERAAGLACEGAVGTTAVLLQLFDRSKQVCEALMQECRSKNPAFEWMQHVENADHTTLVPPITPEDYVSIGTCSMGCFNDVDQVVRASTAPPTAPPFNLFTTAPGSGLCGGALSESLPICIAVSGSCNSADNGDYYRHPSCIDGMPQWVQEDSSHRIRYDGQPQFSQGGKWIVEAGADPRVNYYGELLGRQNSFGFTPVLSIYTWSFKCSQQVNSFTSELAYRQLMLDLGTCSCTRDQDCSGNGRAFGSKEFGPTCRCACDLGFSGLHCEIRLCRAPEVGRALEPSCREGEWLTPGSACNTACEAGYNPTVPVLTCGTDGSLTPSVFECVHISNAPNLEELARREFVGAEREEPPCAALDCGFRGTPTGERDPIDRSCVCVCDQNWGGFQCLTFQGECVAPEVQHSALRTCAEGTVVSTTCTAQCADAYWPEPAVLHCVENQLQPATFQCVGGHSVSDLWCKTMQYLTIGVSVASALGLVAICIYEVTPHTRRVEAFEAGTEDVEVDKDDQGAYNVVRMTGKEMRSGLPPGLKNAIGPAPPLALEQGEPPAAQEGWVQPGALLPLEAGAKEGRPEITLHPDQVLRQAGAPDGAGAPAALMDAEVPEEEAAASDNGGGELQPDPEDGWRSTVAALQDSESALVVPGTVPREPPPVNTEWLMQYKGLEEEKQANRAAEQKRLAAEQGATEREAAEAAAAAVESTRAERAEVEAAMRGALQAGDGGALRALAERARGLLSKIPEAPASVTNPLVRLLTISDARLQQLDERDAARDRREAWRDRVRRGDAADWKMTVEELWVFAEQGNVGAVRAGMKAKLPVLSRSKDGKRFTVVHIACRPACKEALQEADEAAGGGESSPGAAAVEEDELRAESVDEPPEAREEAAKMGRRVAVVAALLEARASANAVDVADRTPLDLAVCEGGSGSADLPVVEALRGLGLLTAKEAAAAARAEAEARAAEEKARVGSARPGRASPASAGTTRSTRFG